MDESEAFGFCSPDNRPRSVLFLSVHKDASKTRKRRTMFRLVVVSFTLLISIAAAFTATTNRDGNVAVIRRGGLAMSATMNRRDVAFAAAALTMGLIASPEQSQAKPASTFFFEDNMVNEPSQMATDGKTDVNAAFVVRSLLGATK
jgi:hypothetical protein